MLAARRGATAALLSLLPLVSSSEEESASRLSAEQWREDLRFVVETIRQTHPQPFRRTSAATFEAQAADLEAAIPNLEDEQVVVRLMQLVASIGDGHTALLPAGPKPLRHCYPVRLHRFYDGVYVLHIRADLGHLAGGRVTKIGDVGIEDAFAKVAAVTSGDSEMGKRWPASIYFTMPNVMHALGLASAPLEMSLTVVTRDGRTTRARLTAVEIQEPPQSWYMRLHGGLFEPPPIADGVSAVSGELPLHLGGLLPTMRVMWFRHLERERALYVQLNAVGDTPDESFAAFNDRLWRYFDDHASAIDKLVFDLRFNRGGDGTLLMPLIHQLIRHESICRRERLFALVGNGTFSAAVNLLAQMTRHTDVTVVGEPTGGPLNWCSDVAFRLLPNSRLPMLVSTLCWQGGHPSDMRGAHPPDFPVLTSGADLLAGRDPVLQAVLEGRARRLTDVLRAEGAEAFRRETQRQSESFAALEWWQPFTEEELGRIGREMLGTARFEEAVAAFEIGTGRHPDSSSLFEGLGDSYYGLGRLESAVRSYERALQIDAGNDNAKRMLERIHAGQKAPAG